jgi:uncharacterized protein
MLANIAPTHILYLHGFRSSPQSAKAQILGRYLQAHHPDIVWHCPQLPPSPASAMAGLDQQIAAWRDARLAVVGASLGGFYADCIVRKSDCRAVLLNPVVAPARDLARHIGLQSAFHNPAEHFYFQPEYVEELRQLEGPAPAPNERIFAVIAQGDEVLDWREMQARYGGCKQTLLPGSDHGLSDFESLLPEVLAHLGLPAPQLARHPNTQST